MYVHIGVGFGVAGSESKAIPEPRIAEQQQCSPAFFVWIQPTNINNTKKQCL